MRVRCRPSRPAFPSRGSLPHHEHPGLRLEVHWAVRWSPQHGSALAVKRIRRRVWARIHHDRCDCEFAFPNATDGVHLVARRAKIQIELPVTTTITGRSGSTFHSRPTTTATPAYRFFSLVLCFSRRHGATENHCLLSLSASATSTNVSRSPGPRSWCKRTALSTITVPISFSCVSVTLWFCEKPSCELDSENRLRTSRCPGGAARAPSGTARSSPA